MYIYVITHPNYNGWIKLGRASNIEERLRSYQTHDPYRAFKLEFRAVVIPNVCKYIENYFKNNISGNGYEWFKCNVDDAIATIEKLRRDQIPTPKYDKPARYKYHYIINGNDEFNTLPEVVKFLGYSKNYVNIINARYGANWDEIVVAENIIMKIKT